MRTNYLSLKGYFILLVLSLQFFNVKAQQTYTYNYTGAVQTVNLPAGIYQIECWGANGETAGNQPAGGIGGYSTGTYTVSSLTTIYVAVGGKGNLGSFTSAFAMGGWNGGGQGYGSTVIGAGGGGASHIATATGVLSSLSGNQPAVLIVAGGGGGSGYAGFGGNGGGAIGGNGNSGTGGNTGGTFGAGANGTTAGTCGGGGGGWFGGNLGSPGNTGGAGGGSGYIGGVTSGTTAQTGQPGFVAKPIVTGDGVVTIKELCSIALTASGSNSLNPSICSGQTLTLTTNAISNYAWSTGNTTSPTIAVSPTITTVYTLSATSPSNCTASKNITVIVNSAGPALTFTTAPSSSTVCLGQTATLTAGGAVSYTLAGGPGNLTNGQTFTPTATSIYTITGQNGCGTASVVTTISVSALPVTAVASNTLICASSQATLMAGGATSYTWMPGTNTNTSYIVAPSVTTAYTVTGQSGNCIGIKTITVNTKANPTISITPSGTAICQGSSVSLVASGTSTSYAWSTGQSGASISAAPQTLTLITVTGTNTNNCTSSVGQVISVNPNPTVTASASNPVVCINGPSTLMASGADTYTWSTGPAGTSVVVNPTAGSTYSVTGSYTTGCSSATVVSVSVLTPTISVTANTAVCSGSHVVIGAMGADTYTWTNNNTTGPNISVGPAATTIYTVTGSVSDAGTGVTCNATNTLQVIVNNNPTITASSNRTNNSICIGESAVLTVSGAGANGTYTWTGGSGAHAASSITVTPIADQTYAVAGTDGNGCRNQAIIQIAVFTCVGIPTNAANPTGLSVYPNPSNGEFTISSNQEITLQISDQLGREVSTILLDGSTEVKVSNLAHGIYFITGQNANGSVKQKLIITK